MKSRPDLKIVVSKPPAAALLPEPAPQQGEMPFAMVNGEPVTELPRDLYIPPQALEVFLEAFEGPLDLLLYLIRRQNLDVLDIPLAEITRQYMKYIELMQDLQLELAGEYLVMAATLAEIKSRMLLPRPKLDEDSEAGPARRTGAAPAGVRALQARRRKHRLAAAAGARRVGGRGGAEDRQVVRPLPQITLQEMLLAFKDVVVRARDVRAPPRAARTPVGARAHDRHPRAPGQGVFLEFVQLFRPEEGRMGVTVTFVAILELMREGLIDIVQAEAFAPLHVRAAQSPPAALRIVSDNTDAGISRGCRGRAPSTMQPG